MIVLGIDLGDRRVGFAVGNTDGLLAVPSGFASVQNLTAAAKAVTEKAATENAGLLVLGHPVNMNGRPGPKAKEAAAFAETLRKQGLTVELWDERLTTSEATRLLKDAGHTRKQRKTLIDQNAAQRLLTSFLECRKRQNEKLS